MAGGVVDADALVRPALAHRTAVLQHLHHHLGRRGNSSGDGRLVDGVFLPQPELHATAAGLRLVRERSIGTRTWITTPCNTSTKDPSSSARTGVPRRSTASSWAWA